MNRSSIIIGGLTYIVLMLWMSLASAQSLQESRVITENPVGSTPTLLSPVRDTATQKDGGEYYPKIKANGGMYVNELTFGTLFSAKYVFQDQSVVSFRYIKPSVERITDYFLEGWEVALLYGYHLGDRLFQASGSAGISYQDYESRTRIDQSQTQQLALAANVQASISYKIIGIGLNFSVSYAKDPRTWGSAFIEVGKLW